MMSHVNIFKIFFFIVVVLDVSGAMPDSYSPTYVEAAWYAWWEKEVSIMRLQVNLVFN